MLDEQAAIAGTSKSKVSITIEAKRFSAAVEELMHAAEAALNAATKKLNAAKAWSSAEIGAGTGLGNYFLDQLEKALPQIVRDTIVEKEYEATRNYERLFSAVRYIFATRLPNLPADAVLSLVVDIEDYNNLSNLIAGRGYSLKALAKKDDWFGRLAAATDKYISRKRISKEAHIHNSTINCTLKAQTHNDAQKKAAIEILKASPCGADFFTEAEDYKYETYFVDMQPYNMIAADLGRAEGDALCCAQREIFVDSYPRRNHVFRAIKLGHEAAHTVQIHRHFGLAAHGDNTIVRKVERHYKRYAALMEGHSVGVEHVIGADLMRAGFDQNEVYGALHYGLPDDIVNLLHSNPAGFIRAAASSKAVIEGWKLKKDQLEMPQHMIDNFASSLPYMGKSFSETRKEAGQRLTVRVQCASFNCDA